MKATVASVLHAGKLRLESWCNGIRAHNTIGGAEVEVAVVPLAINIYDVIELLIVGRRFDVCGLQNGFDKFVGPGCYFCFKGIGNLGSGRFGRAIHPPLLLLWHAVCSLDVWLVASVNSC